MSNRLAGMTGPGSSALTSMRPRSRLRFVSTQGSGLSNPEPDDSDEDNFASFTNWNGWTHGFGLGGHVSSDGNATATDYQTGGTLFGMDRWLNDTTMFGILGGYAGTSVRDSQDGSNAQLTSYQFGLYELHRHDTLYVSNIDAFTNNSLNIARQLNFGSIQQAASGTSNGNQWSHYTEAGTTLELDDLRLQPFVGVQYMYLDQGGYTETGAGSLNLTTGHQIVNSIRNSLGARFFQEVMWGRIALTPSLSARYLREWGDGTQMISSSLAGAPTIQFMTNGNHTGRDFGLLSFSTNALVSDQFSLFGSVDTQVAANFYSVIGSGGFQYSW